MSQTEKESIESILNAKANLSPNHGFDINDLKNTDLKRRYHRLMTTRCHYRRKRTLIKVLGGKCEKCGLTLEQAKNIGAVFDIHEVDIRKIRDKPLRTVKEKKFAESTLTPERIAQAVRWHKEGKIKLLCRNCHTITHFDEKTYFTFDITDEELEFINDSNY